MANKPKEKTKQTRDSKHNNQECSSCFQLPATNFAQIAVVRIVLIVRLQGAQRRFDHPLAAPWAAHVVVVLLPELFHLNQVGRAGAGAGRVQHVRRRRVRQLNKLVVKNHLLGKF